MVSSPNLPPALAEEIEAINSIYDPDTVSLPSSAPSTSIQAILKFPLRSLSFILSFPSDYPQSPPTITGTASTGQHGKPGDGDVAVRVLREVVTKVWYPGQVCLFDVIEEAESRLPALHEGDDEPQPGAPDGPGPTDPDAEHHADPTPSTTPFPPPQWTTSTPLTLKKSTFLARCSRVSSRDQALAALSHLKSTDRKVAAATHNISAYRIRAPADAPNPHGSTRHAALTHAAAATRYHSDHDDDGETAAGGRLARLLELTGAEDVVVVVSRWFGGVLLGAERFKCLNRVAREALVEGGFVVEGGKQGR